MAPPITHSAAARSRIHRGKSKPRNPKGSSSVSIVHVEQTAPSQSVSSASTGVAHHFQSGGGGGGGAVIV